jgi:exopolysaccharide biosynthesis polyprenyl glycosylphosphotransferase
MLRRFSINFAIFSMILDAFLVDIGLVAAVYIRPFLDGLPFVKPIPEQVNLPPSIYIAFPLVWVGILSAFAIYDGRKYLQVVDEYAMLSLASMIASISMAGILYLSYRQVSRILFFSFVLIVYILFLTWRGIARAGFRLRKAWPDAPRRVLIVGAGPLGRRIGDQIREARIENMQCMGYVDDEMKFDKNRPKLLGKFCDIREIVKDASITDVVIALPHSVYERMSEVVNTTTDLPVKVWVAMGFFDLALYKTGIEDFAGVPMIDLRAPALSEYQRFAKRGFDLFFGAVALVLAFPFMVLIALVIWIFDGRPVFFLQKRVGENGRIFNMYKFRTMVKNADQLKETVEQTDAEGNLIHKSQDDPRVTGVGRFLRRFSLDELPQILNVLVGTMSLVGPRPELPYLVERYHAWQRKRFAVPPGITGWWQVNGRSERVMHLHTEDDLYYINNYSIWLDIQILVRTLWVVVIGKGSY